jgi:Tol biopolymer transport system component
MALILAAVTAVLSCTNRAIVLEETEITQLQQVTTDKSFEIDPAYFPDGSRIAFCSNRGGFVELWAIASDGGGGVAQLTSSVNASYDLTPRVSPDGSTITFVSDRVSGVANIWTVELGNRGLTQLTNSPNGCIGPSWSPDGKSIAYTGYDQKSNPYIWTMKVDGSQRQQLAAGRDPEYSPDGKLIAFSRNTPTPSRLGIKEDDWNIWMMKSNGTEPYQLTSDPKRQEFSPRWSTDGKRVVYVAQYTTKPLITVKREELKPQQKKSEVWMKDVYSGTAATQLTAFKGINAAPCWSPDGKRIAFCSNRSGSWDLWAMTPRGE